MLTGIPSRMPCRGGEESAMTKKTTGHFKKNALIFQGKRFGIHKKTPKRFRKDMQETSIPKKKASLLRQKGQQESRTRSNKKKAYNLYWKHFSHSNLYLSTKQTCKGRIQKTKVCRTTSENPELSGTAFLQPEQTILSLPDCHFDNMTQKPLRA